jgi:hypothetical protein
VQQPADLDVFGGMVRVNPAGNLFLARLPLEVVAAAAARYSLLFILFIFQFLTGH